ncbi:BnaCnng51560D [Brassica napus]|uniref:(rape) hypothetical protein n=1 Tax=Brassica napus TaxID=3708 RepID=A0A078JMI8_BRANA|nr:unnamed protein product [Brassica napus]CDY66592.1 BnaCnng51560D [Brassica napus]
MERPRLIPKGRCSPRIDPFSGYKVLQAVNIDVISFCLTDWNITISLSVVGLVGLRRSFSPKARSSMLRLLCGS